MVSGGCTSSEDSRSSKPSSDISSGQRNLASCNAENDTTVGHEHSRRAGLQMEKKAHFFVANGSIETPLLNVGGIDADSGFAQLSTKSVNTARRGG